jgi:sarcosine oxidase subunit gamma
VSLSFLTPAGGATAVAVSPFDAATSAAGASFEVRDGWRVPTGFGEPQAEARAVEEAVGWADVSHLGKLEIQVGAGAARELAGLAAGMGLGRAASARGALWCLLTPVRALVIGDTAAVEARPGMSVVDVTTQFSVLRIGGPLARETFARFCALDLRPGTLPVGGCMPGSVARTPGLVVREGADQFLVLTGAAVALYLWEVVTDAGTRLGGRPVGADAMPAWTELAEEGAGTHA